MWETKLLRRQSCSCAPTLMFLLRIVAHVLGVPLVLMLVTCYFILRALGFAFLFLIRCLRHVKPMLLFLLRGLKALGFALLFLIRCLRYFGPVLLYLMDCLVSLGRALLRYQSSETELSDSELSESELLSLRSGGDRTRRPRNTKMNDVNMPSGTKVSITIPAKSGCSCPTFGANAKLITLKPDGVMSGREYKIVSDEMHKTLKLHNYKSYSIKQIIKVRNCCLWAKFRVREKEIKKEAGYVNERMLFHGSPSADIIAKNGFDISKANSGLFGKGVYFAQHSSKSNNYTAGYLGHRKMLFCRVALGRMHKLTSSNSGLTAPPPRHQSVEGNLAVPEYIVYNDAQAYPEYLVHYDIVS